MTHPTIMQWVANNPQSMTTLAASIDARLHGCAVGGVSGDDVVMDVITSRHDAVLSGADDAHNLAILRVYCYRRLVDVIRADRSAGSSALDMVATIDTAIDALGGLGDTLQRLPASYLQVLILHCIDGWSLVDVAGLVGVSYAVVRGRYARALKRAQRELNK